MFCKSVVRPRQSAPVVSDFHVNFGIQFLSFDILLVIGHFSHIKGRTEEPVVDTRAPTTFANTSVAAGEWNRSSSDYEITKKTIPDCQSSPND
mmetsp:Transcript_1677/g.3579  ORF Transcript_1677/g.3579 Transcript_1677/m.3579 type:complete len:93 (-) Transcript_1677:47-325(-)